MGRPSSYTDEIADQICGKLISGLSLREICAEDEFPDDATVYRWIANNAIFRDKYACAREAQAARYAEEIVGISDDGTNDWMERQNSDGSSYTVVNSEHIQRSKLRVDARKWVASKLLPKVYGDRTELVGAGGKDLIPAEVDNTKLALVLMAILEGKKPDGAKG